MHKFNWLIIFITSICCKYSYSQYIWKKSIGLDSVIATQFVFDSNDNYYIANEDSGVYTSKDYGLSWEIINSGIVESNKTVTCIIADSSNIFAAVGSSMGGHLYVSNTNNINNWNATSFPTGLSDLIIIDSIICASTGSGNFIKYLSNDYGITWTFNMFSWNYYLRNYKKTSDTIYASSVSYGLMYSIDKGANFYSIGFGGLYINDYILYQGKIIVYVYNGIYIYHQIMAILGI